MTTNQDDIRVGFVPGHLDVIFNNRFQKYYECMYPSLKDTFQQLIQSKGSCNLTPEDFQGLIFSQNDLYWFRENVYTVNHKLNYLIKPSSPEYIFEIKDGVFSFTVKVTE